MNDNAEPVGWEDIEVAVGDARIAAQIMGGSARQAVLLINAATWSRDWWPDGLCTWLHAEGLRVIRYDTRDTGQSTAYPVGEPGYDADTLVDDAIAVLDSVGADRGLVMGISMGGGVAQRLAAQHPERVAGLVLVSTSPADDVDRNLPAPTAEIMATFEEGSPAPDWSDRASVVDWVLESERPYAGPGNFDEVAMRALVEQVWERTASMEAAATNHFSVAEAGAPVDLSGIRDIPSLVVHGSHDPLFPVAHGEALAHAVDAPLLVLHEVGHQAPPATSWPELVAAIVDVARRAGTR